MLNNCQKEEIRLEIDFRAHFLPDAVKRSSSTSCDLGSKGNFQNCRQTIFPDDHRSKRRAWVTQGFFHIRSTLLKWKIGRRNICNTSNVKRGKILFLCFKIVISHIRSPGKGARLYAILERMMYISLLLL